MKKLLVLMGFALVITSCLQITVGDNTDDESSTPRVLTVQTTWYWQLNGSLRTDIPAELYDVDLFDTSSETISQLKKQGKIVICYFSAGSYEEWRPDAYKFPSEAIGNPLDNWSGEYWLDIRNPEIWNIMRDRLDLAVAKGCDGVEPDNVDGYTNDTGFDLNYNDQLRYNRFLADEAKSRGLLIGLKNDLEQIPDLVDYFDFAINEECHKYDECDLLQSFIKQGKPVFNAEYDDIYVYNENTFRNLCNDAKNRNFRTNVYPIELDGSFVRSCDYGEY